MESNKIETFLAKKVESWIVLLIVFLGILLLLAYGTAVHYTVKGGSKLGRAGDIVSSFSGAIMSLNAGGQTDYISPAPKIPRPENLFKSVELPSGDVEAPLRYWVAEYEFQPMAVLVRTNDAGAEILMILDEKRQPVRSFPVSAESLGGKYDALMGVSETQMLSDGTIIVFPHAGDGLYRKDLCGNVIWKQHGLYHHHYSIADGKLYVLGLPKADISSKEQSLWNSSDILNIIDLETGKIDKSIRIEEIAMKNSHKFDPLQLSKWQARVNENGVLDPDYLHLNKVQVLDEKLADQYPDFNAGDLLVSSRWLNLLMILDPKSLEISWFSHGYTQMQHDPDFIGDNKIVVFNNQFSGNKVSLRDKSNFLAISEHDFSTNKWQQTYNAEKEGGYTRFGGSLDVGRSGDIVIAITLQGRYLELSPEKQPIFELINFKDEESVFWVKHAEYLTPQQYETVKNLRCSGEVGNGLKT